MSVSPRRSRAPVTAPLAVLDSEALSAVAFPHERARAARRAQVVLEAVERMGGRACVPAPVLAEVAHTDGRRAGVDRVLRRIPVVSIDRTIAVRAGSLLECHDLDSCHAVDAFVAATAIVAGHAVILTGDPVDLRNLTSGTGGVVVQGLL